MKVFMIIPRVKNRRKLPNSLNKSILIFFLFFYSLVNSQEKKINPSLHKIGFLYSSAKQNNILFFDRDYDYKTNVYKFQLFYVLRKGKNLQLPMINEAIETLFNGVAGVTEIDTVMKLGMAHPMGPLQLADFIGLDVCLSILEVMYNGFKNPKYAPCPLLVNMVRAGKLGVKSGEGFYDYSKSKKSEKIAKQFE